jgi:hypothetical protein
MAPQTHISISLSIVKPMKEDYELALTFVKGDRSGKAHSLGRNQLSCHSSDSRKIKNHDSASRLVAQIHR